MAPTQALMSRFADQTREIEALTNLFRRLRAAEKSGDYSPVERLIAEDATLRTAAGERKGRAAVLDHLRAMGKERYRAQIVAPKGGLMTVLVAPVALDGAPLGPGREQVYRLLHGRVVEVIDLGRTQDMVYRRESQPN